MLFKIIVISIFVGVCVVRISSAQKVAPVIPCNNEQMFLEQAKQLNGIIVAVVFTNHDTPMPCWLPSKLGEVVSYIIEINIGYGLRTLTKVKFFFNNCKYPTLYVIHKGFLLKEKILLNIPKYELVIGLISRALNHSAETYPGRVDVEFEKLLNTQLNPKAKAESSVGNTARITAGSAAVSMARSNAVSAAGSNISSAQKVAQVLSCFTDNEFLDLAKQSLGKTVAVVFTNYKNPMPCWVPSAFGEVVSNIIEIKIVNNAQIFTKVKLFFKNCKYPTLYVIQMGFLLTEKLWLETQIGSRVSRMIGLAQDPDATKYDVRVDKAFESILKMPRGSVISIQQAKAESSAGNTAGITAGSAAISMAGSTAISAAGITAVRTEETRGLGKRTFFEYDLNEVPPIPDYWQKYDNNNSNKRTHTAGSGVSPSWQDDFGEIYEYTTFGGGLSTSSPAPQIGSRSGRPLSRSPSVPTGSSSGRPPSKSPSLPPRKYGK